MGERSADDIQGDIERARVGLASAVDELAERTSPHRVVDRAKQGLREKINSTPGRIAIGVMGGVVVLLIVKRVRNR